jgi:hypothetical protein
MKKIFILVSAIALFTACQKEVSRDGSAPVQIRISTGSSLGGAKTRANDYADNAVVRVDVLVFDNSATPTNHLDAELVEIRYAYKKSGGSDIYSTTLKAGSNLDLYFAINAQQIIEDADLTVKNTATSTAGDTWEDVLEALIMTPADMINRPEYGLPMWGYRYGETINQNAANNNFGTVYMTRAVASADIEISATNFTLLEASAEYVTDKGYLGYLVDADNLKAKDDDKNFIDLTNLNKPNAHYWLISPNIPTDATTGTSPNDYRVAHTLNKTTGTVGYDGNNSLNRLYFFENDGPNSETAPTNGRQYTKIVLKGIWDDPDVAVDTKETYYPLAFRNRNENGDLINERVDVIRNRKFEFSISNVNGHGYDNPEDAKKGGDLNMKYEVIAWDEWEDTDLVVGSDSRWISFSPSRNKTEVKQASLYRNATSTDEISFTTNYDPEEFALTLSDSGAEVTLTADEEAAGVLAKVANAHYEITLVYLGDNAADEAMGKFIFTAKHDYVSSTPESVLTVSNAYVKFLLRVDQENATPEDWIDGGKQPWTAEGND